MSPNNNEVQPMELPAPAMEQAPNGGAPVETAPQGAERAPMSEQLAQTAPAAAPSLPGLPLAVPVDTPAPVHQSDVSATTQGNPLLASDDADVIEKEWVNKAKQIVEQNREDPYKQSEELTVFKADYMKKRYNKTIKIDK